MNELNYASLEASKKLVDNGIVLETEAGWYKIFRPGCHAFVMVLSMRSGNEKFYGDNYPAPSMAEVWRELPAKIGADHILEIYKEYGFTKAQYWGLDLYGYSKNPTDALIDLLVWLKGEGK